jgi:hypothetical protein
MTICGQAQVSGQVHQQLAPMTVLQRAAVQRATAQRATAQRATAQRAIFRLL